MFKKFLLLVLALVGLGSTVYAGATVLDYLSAGDNGTTGFVTANFTKAAGFDLAIDYIGVYISCATPTLTIYENGNFGTAVRTYPYGASSAFTQFNNGVIYVTSSPNVTQVDVVADGDGAAVKAITVGAKAIR